MGKKGSSLQNQRRVFSIGLKVTNEMTFQIISRSYIISCLKMFLVTTNFSCLAPMYCDFRPISVGRISISWVLSITMSSRWYFLWLTLELTYMRRLATVEIRNLCKSCFVELKQAFFFFFYYYYLEQITFIARGKATLESEARISRKRGNYSRYTVIETSIKVYISHFCYGNSNEMICLCSNTVTVQWVMIDLLINEGPSTV